MTTGDDCLHLLRVCSNLLGQESFGTLTGAIIPLLTSSQHQSLLTQYVFLETYSKVIEKAHEFTVQSQGEDSEITPEDYAASISLFQSLIAKLYEVTATGHFDQEPNAEVVEQLCDTFSTPDQQYLSAKTVVHLITLDISPRRNTCRASASETSGSSDGQQSQPASRWNKDASVNNNAYDYVHRRDPN